MANPWGAVIAGGGQALSAGADYLAAKKREEILNHLLKRRQFQQGQIDDEMLSFIGGLRDSSPEAERTKATAEFLSAIKANQAQVNPGTPRGQISDREAAELAGLDSHLNAYGAEEADIEAALAAPMRQRLNEELRAGRTGTKLDLMKRRIESTDYLGQLRLARARANPWMKALGEAMKGAGSAVSGGFGGFGGKGGGMPKLGQSARANFDPSIYD